MTKLLASYKITEMCYNCGTGIKRWHDRFLARSFLSDFPHCGTKEIFVNSTADSSAAVGVLCFLLFPRSSAIENSARLALVWCLWIKSHVRFLLLVNCFFVGESFTLWAMQWVWTGTAPGRHTTSGSLKVLWHKWHPFFSDTKIGFFRSFSCEDKRYYALKL